MLASVRPILRAIGATVVPEAGRLDEAEWTALERIVADALAARPRAVRRQVLLFVRLVQWLPLVRHGRRFTQLNADDRTRFLETLQNSAILLLRRGCWGVRTLLLMGYYGRPEAARAIGYAADPRGWEARR
ncbi:MAG TPA: hypothetical protein VH833_01465 [Gemmatimonadales bacterium]